MTADLIRVRVRREPGADTWAALEAALALALPMWQCEIHCPSAARVVWRRRRDRADRIGRHVADLPLAARTRAWLADPWSRDADLDIAAPRDAVDWHRGYRDTMDGVASRARAGGPWPGPDEYWCGGAAARHDRDELRRAAR